MGTERVRVLSVFAILIRDTTGWYDAHRIRVLRLRGTLERNRD